MNLCNRRTALFCFVLAFVAGIFAVPVQARETDLSIAISGPSTAGAGTTVCVTVTSTSGNPAVKVEQGDRDIKVVPRQTEHGTILCFVVPPGTAGQDISVTATDSNGDVVTKTIRVT